MPWLVLVLVFKQALRHFERNRLVADRDPPVPHRLGVLADLRVALTPRARGAGAFPVRDPEIPLLVGEVVKLRECQSEGSGEFEIAAIIRSTCEEYSAFGGENPAMFTLSAAT